MEPDQKLHKRVLPYNADPAVGYQTAATRPGGLRGVAELYVQTRQAQRLVLGRAATEERPAITGLVRFGMIVRHLWGAAAQDDPYADWYLLQTLESLEHGREELERMEQDVEGLLQGIQGVDISIAESQKPARIPLQFANPYGYMGAYLISDYDRFARAVLTARHVGLLDRDTSERFLGKGGRLVRRAFAATQGYKHCAVARDDMAANNARAREAIAAMGALPQDVLKGETRPRIAPEIRRSGVGWIASGEPSAGSPGDLVGMRKSKRASDDDPITADFDDEDDGDDAGDRARS
jgi:integrating conjugative element protein (TIGR03761 family)